MRSWSSWSKIARWQTTKLHPCIYPNLATAERDWNVFFSYNSNNYIQNKPTKKYHLSIVDFRAAKKLGRILRKYNKKNGGI